MEFKFPDVGEGIHEGKIVKWLVKEGDEIKTDQALAEVETDKAIVEIPSPVSGKIEKITHKEGDVIKVGETLATISTLDVDPTSNVEKQESRESTGVVGAIEDTAPGVMAAPDITSSGAVFGGEKQKTEDSTLNIPPTSNVGPTPSSGYNTIKSGIKAQKKYDLFGYIDREPYEGMRKTIGDHMVKSKTTIPHVTHTDTADVSALSDLRDKEKVNAKKEGVHLTFLAYILKAATQALTEHPHLNASLDEETPQVIIKKYYNIGIAVDTEAGLIVPVLKGADKKPVNQIAKEIEELAEKARSRKINPMDLKGGTFSITNVGSTGGGLFFTPVINHPESAILGVGMIKETPLVVEGNVVPRKVLPISLSFDHRIVDGAEAARFTNTLKDLLEHPEKIT